MSHASILRFRDADAITTGLTSCSPAVDLVCGRGRRLLLTGSNRHLWIAELSRQSSPVLRNDPPENHERPVVQKENRLPVLTPDYQTTPQPPEVLPTSDTHRESVSFESPNDM